MRIRIGVHNPGTSLPTVQTLWPGRGVVYALLGESAPDLATELHTRGWQGKGMVPFTYNRPYFAAKTRQGTPIPPDRYAMCGDGTWSVSTPVEEIGIRLWEALSHRLMHNPRIKWGTTSLTLTRLYTPETPEKETGTKKQMRTTTPVVMRDPGPPKKYCTANSPDFPGRIQSNLEHKARVLGEEPPRLISIDQIGKNQTTYGRTTKPHTPNKIPGNTLTLTLEGTPTALAAMRAWGLGSLNSSGLGWVS